jgi:NAD-dependent SIR2 family protein deacetylase
MTLSSIVPVPPVDVDAASIRRLARLIENSRRVMILTGAGCSTESGIPDYRSPGGSWTRHRPVQFGEFVRLPERRRRYWARSFLGWRRFASAAPNATHRWVASLEDAGTMTGLVTQNVDELHTAAGSRNLVELHGSNHRVICLDCGATWPREEHQALLALLNPGWNEAVSAIAPDGDAPLGEERERSFVVAECAFCGGMPKPDVVFFGESVPRERVDRAMSWLARSDLLLVLGSSLQVWSGFRFARAAHAAGIPVVSVNIGPNRADDLLTLKIEGRCSEVLGRIPVSSIRTSPAQERA